MDTFISLYYGGEFTHEGTNKTYQLIYFYGRYSILAITMHNKCIQICVDPNFKTVFLSWSIEYLGLFHKDPNIFFWIVISRNMILSDTYIITTKLFSILTGAQIYSLQAK